MLTFGLITRIKQMFDDDKVLASCLISVLVPTDKRYNCRMNN